MNLPNTYAAGDYVETYHRLFERCDYLPLDPTAHKQGRVAGDQKIYYPEFHKLTNRITGGRETGPLLGAQMVGRRTGVVSKRLDALATALFNGMRVEALSDVDRSHTPLLSIPWDLVQVVAQRWMRQL